MICICGHHRRCHFQSGRCEHRTCGCLIFEPDADAETIAFATEPLAVSRSASAAHGYFVIGIILLIILPIPLFMLHRVYRHS